MSFITAFLHLALRETKLIFNLLDNERIIDWQVPVLDGVIQNRYILKFKIGIRHKCTVII